MLDPEVESELTLANEFVLEAQKTETCNTRGFSSVSQTSKPNFSAGLESTYDLCFENDFGCFVQPKNDDQSLITLDQMDSQLDKKDLLGYSPADQSSFQLVPDICVDPNTTICYQKDTIDTCSLWEANGNYFGRAAVGCLIESQTSSSCCCGLPNIIESMNKIKLLERVHNTPKEFPLYIKEEPIEQDIRVDFYNLKDVYSRQDLQHANNIEDPTVYMFVKTESRISGVKVFLKKLHNLQDDGLTTNGCNGPILLPSEYNSNQGILSVKISCLSVCLPQRYGKGCLDELSSFYQLIIEVELKNGKSLCHFSKSFQIQTKINEFEDEVEFASKLRQFPTDHTGSSSLCYSLNPYSFNMEEISYSKTKPFAQQECLRPSNLQPIQPQKNKLIDKATSNVGTKTIVLVPGSTLDVNMISSKMKEENDIVSIQEQSNFTGLLKIMKTSELKDSSRRKANGYRSAEEAFVWACGHCLFSRGKKSTVKSHVSRQVCQKRRRLLSEVKEERRLKPKFRRCYTFNGIQSKPMRNYNLKRCKTP